MRHHVHETDDHQACDRRDGGLREDTQARLGAAHHYIEHAARAAVERAGDMGRSGYDAIDHHDPPKRDHYGAGRQEHVAESHPPVSRRHRKGHEGHGSPHCHDRVRTEERQRRHTDRHHTGEDDHAVRRAPVGPDRIEFEGDSCEKSAYEHGGALIAQPVEPEARHGE